MKDKNWIKKIYVAAAAVISAITLAGILPPIRRGAIQYIADNYMHRPLNTTYWMQQLLALFFLAFILNILVFLAVMTTTGRKLVKELSCEMKGKALSVYADKKPILIFFALFSFAMLTVFRADYYYGGADDLFRAMTGERAWRNFYRYVSHFMSIFVHTSPKIFDIAPLTQLMALLIMATVTVMLIRIAVPGQGAAGSRLSPLIYLAGLPVCIYPYFLDNLSYRYDSPYMALSVLFSVLPFLFTHRLRYFAPVSLVSLFLMCLSYQAASGVYIVVCAFCVFRMWSQENLELKRIFLFILTSVACYMISLVIFFTLFNVQPTSASYVDKNVDMSAFASNVQSYLWQLSYDIGHSTIKLSLILLIPLFIASSCIASRRSKAQTIPVALLLLAFCSVFSAGAFLAMGRPLWEPRSKFSFGILVGLASICCTAWTAGKATATGPGKMPARHRLLTCFSRAAILLLAYSCVTFSFALGNAQASQKKYTAFRLALLMEDMAHLVPEEKDDIHIYTLSNIGFTKIVNNLADTYPVTLHMIELMGGHGVIFAMQDYGFGSRPKTGRYSTPKPSLDGLNLAADCQYHSIYEDADENSFYILFKEPAITLRE